VTATDPTGPPPSAKITAAHRAKLAVVYVRQSTAQQVAENRESLARQYALADHARGLGWPADRVLVIDDDLGLSGRTADGRPGFQRLLAEVTMDHAGLVLGLEMSRLARSCKDWHHLLEVCGIFGALLADQDGVYDPADPNDRLLLGLKGEISALELHTIRTRLDRGRVNKAHRGELFLHAPIGYVKAPAGGLALDPDEQVRSAVRLVFDTFAELGTAHAVVRYLRQHQVRVGVRRIDGPDRGTLEWRPARLSTVYRMLRHPAYAGTYAFGRFPIDPKRRRRDGQTPCVRHAPPGEWAVTIPDCLPAYITWDQFQRNAERLRQNRCTATTRGHSRRGAALLSGLVVCGRCGGRMNVLCGTATRPRYECVAHLQVGDPAVCPGVNAAVLDDVVAEQVLRALTPAGIELSLAAAGDIERGRGRLDAHWRSELERAGYEARLAERAYRAVDPENRLVARTLERGWEESLRREREVREGYDRFARECPRQLSPGELARIRALAADIPALWHAPDTPPADRKEIVRALVERVTADIPGNAETVRVRVRWVGGSVTEHTVRRRVGRYEQVADFPCLRGVVEAGRAAGRTAAEIAADLNRAGFRPASGRFDRFTPRLAADLVYRLGLSPPRRPATGLGADEWWARDLADKIGVPLTRLRHWVKKGYLRPRSVGRRGHLVVWADAAERDRLRRLRDHPRANRLHPYPAELIRPADRPGGE
jgi:DNA invertase Pin-like site-specific DNA recombinase